MLDATLRPLIDKPLNRMGRWLYQQGISATHMTVAGFFWGVMAMMAVAAQFYTVAFTFLLLNRLCDGLDGAVARASQLTDFGGFLDIVSDFIIYGGLVTAFAYGHPETMPYALFLLFSFMGPMVSFLAYAILAAKAEKNHQRQGVKSFYYLGGLCEGTETFIFLGTICLFPQAFIPLALIFGVLCWVTLGGRVYAAWRDFSPF